MSGFLGLCVLCKQWKPEVDAWQHICDDCVDACAKQEDEKNDLSVHE